MLPAVARLQSCLNSQSSKQENRGTWQLLLLVSSVVQLIQVDAVVKRHHYNVEFYLLFVSPSTQR